MAGCATPDVGTFLFLIAITTDVGTSDSQELSGVMGGNCDWAKETLAFGLRSENACHVVFAFVAEHGWCPDNRSRIRAET